MRSVLDLVTPSNNHYEANNVKAIDPRGQFVVEATNNDDLILFLGDLQYKNFDHGTISLNANAKDWSVLHVAIHPIDPVLGVVLFSRESSLMQLYNFDDGTRIHEFHFTLPYVGHYRRFVLTETHIFLKHIMDPENSQRNEEFDQTGAFVWKILRSDLDGTIIGCMNHQPESKLPPTLPFMANTKCSRLLSTGDHTFEFSIRSPFSNNHYLQSLPSMSFIRFDEKEDMMPINFPYFCNLITRESYTSTLPGFREFVYYTPREPFRFWVATNVCIMEYTFTADLSSIFCVMVYHLDLEDDIEFRVCPVKEMVITKGYVKARSLTRIYQFQRYIETNEFEEDSADHSTTGCL